MQYTDLMIVEENGWSKKVSLTKAITMVGSAAQCDVQVNTRAIAPVQLQLLSSSDLPTGCKLVNLAAPITFKSNGESRTIGQFDSCDIHQHDELKLGEFHILFELPFTAEQVQKTASMEASLSFVNAVVRPEYPLEGKLVVKNLGIREGTQFQVDLQGLPVDCFQIDPIPFLYPGAQEEIRLRLFHHTLYPDVGQHTILVIITAPNDYPGEELVLEQQIYVAPVFIQTLVVVDDIAEQEAILKSAAAQAKDVPVPAAEISPQLVAPVPSAPQNPILQVEPQKEEPQFSDWPPTPVSPDEREAAMPAIWNGYSSTAADAEPIKETPVEPQLAVEMVSAFPEKSLEVEDHDMFQTSPMKAGPIELLPEPAAAPLISALKQEIKPLETHQEQPQIQTPLAAGPDRSKIKVMRQTSHEIWNEE